ncbi:MAG: hypothetical protein ACI4SJ_03375, partial [Candidatus Avispirillum sp.]
GIVKVTDGGDSIAYMTADDNNTVFHKYDIASQKASGYDISSYLILSYYDETGSSDKISISDFCCLGDKVYILSDILSGKRLLIEIHPEEETAFISGYTDSDIFSVEVTPDGENLILEERSDTGTSLFVYYTELKECALFEKNAGDYKVSPDGRCYSYIKCLSDFSIDKTLIVKNAESEEIIMQMPTRTDNGALEEFGGYDFNLNGNSICYMVHEQNDSFWDLISGKNQQQLRTKCYYADIETGNIERIYSTKWEKWDNTLKTFFVD